MSSPESRKRQRNRRRAREKLWAAERDLAERQVDLVSYERVLADMEKRQLASLGEAPALTIVRVCRDAILRDCEAIEHHCKHLTEIVASLDPPREIPDEITGAGVSVNN